MKRRLPAGGMGRHSRRQGIKKQDKSLKKGKLEVSNNILLAEMKTGGPDIRILYILARVPVHYAQKYDGIDTKMGHNIKKIT